MNKNIQNINCINTEELIQKSKFIENFCINYITEEGIVIKKSFPLKNELRINSSDNWNLEENDKEKILENLKELENYSSNIFNFLLENKIYSEKVEIKDFTKILPPWIVFPNITKNEKRNQKANLYREVFKRFYNNLTKEELETYDKMYPIPKHY